MICSVGELKILPRVVSVRVTSPVRPAWSPMVGCACALEGLMALEAAFVKKFGHGHAGQPAISRSAPWRSRMLPAESQLE